MADWIGNGHPQLRPNKRRKWIIVSLILVGAGVTAILVVLTRADGDGHQGNSPRGPGVATKSPANCADADSNEALRGFVHAWNRHDDGGLTNLITGGAELDMSSESQRALPPAKGGGYTSTHGRRAIMRFVHARWRLGERLSFARSAPFAGGVVAVNMLAAFRDGRFQHMVEAKFAIDCPRARFNHIVIGSGEVAR